MQPPVDGPYIAYVDRGDENKGVGELLRYFPLPYTVAVEVEGCFEIS